MTVRLLNEMPDAEVRRGDPVKDFSRELSASHATKNRGARISGRAVFLAATVALHVVALLASMQVQIHERLKSDPVRIVAPLIEVPAQSGQAPPMIDSVEYVRAPPPVYPRESQRNREHGTVVLRVLVDALGRPAQIQLERSSGFERLDLAAREAVQKFLFRPYVVDGVAKPAQAEAPRHVMMRASG